MKYNIIKFVTPELRKELLKELDLSRSTFHRKATAKIGDSNGFEIFEMYLISSILKKELHELLTSEAVAHYSKRYFS
jgi:hypothetical protein